MFATGEACAALPKVRDRKLSQRHKLSDSYKPRFYLYQPSTHCTRDSAFDERWPPPACVPRYGNLRPQRSTSPTELSCTKLGLIPRPEFVQVISRRPRSQRNISVLTSSAPPPTGRHSHVLLAFVFDCAQTHTRTHTHTRCRLDGSFVAPSKQKMHC